MNTSLDDFGKLILRLSVGGMLLMHGLAKFSNGIGFVQQAVTKAGLPEAIGYFVYAGEIAAPVLLILGVLARPAGLIIAIDLAGAVFLGRRNDIATLNQGGGWAIEVEMMFLLGGLAIACLGAGRLGIGKPGRWN